MSLNVGSLPENQNEYRAGDCLARQNIARWSSAEIGFLPAWPTLDFNRQSVRNARRCQSTTVSGFTNSREFFHSEQNRLTAIQKHESHLARHGSAAVA